MYLALDAYTYLGYTTSAIDVVKITVPTRLRRIEGQVGGLHRMVEDSCYCIDVLTQINAVRAAPHKVEAEILRNHVTHRVGDAFATAAASTDSGRR